MSVTRTLYVRCRHGKVVAGMMYALDNSAQHQGALDYTLKVLRRDEGRERWDTHLDVTLEQCDEC